MKTLNLPCSKDELKSLRCKEKVLLNGYIYTARDAAHKKLVALIKDSKPLPFDLKDQAIYYVGPTPAPKNMAFGSAGPTTSSRMDAYTKDILDQGCSVLIGKGYRSKEVIDELVKNQSVYFVAIGGAGAILGSCVKSSEIIAFPELDTECIRKIKVENFPVFVGIDTLGNNIYE